MVSNKEEVPDSDVADYEPGESVTAEDNVFSPIPAPATSAAASFSPAATGSSPAAIPLAETAAALAAEATAALATVVAVAAPVADSSAEVAFATDLFHYNQRSPCRHRSSLRRTDSLNEEAVAIAAPAFAVNNV